MSLSLLRNFVSSLLCQCFHLKFFLKPNNVYLHINETTWGPSESQIEKCMIPKGKNEGKGREEKNDSGKSV